MKLRADTEPALPPHWYAVTGGKVLVAVGAQPSRPGDKVTVALYRNLEDLAADQPMDRAAELEKT